MSEPIALYPYQRRGAWWLAQRRRAMLADDAGLGKTLQALAACTLVGARKVQVVCPAAARPVWEAHAEMLRPDGTMELSAVSYASAARPRLSLWRQVQKDVPDVLILDEAHYLKNRKSARTKAIYGRHCDGSAWFDQIAHVWALTATPAPNDISETWTAFRALRPDLIRPPLAERPMNFSQFVERFAETVATPFGLRITGTKQAALPLLRELLPRLMLRRTLADVGLELPPLVWREPTWLVGGREDMAALKEALRAIQTSAGGEGIEPYVAVAQAMLDGTTRRLWQRDGGALAMATVARLTAAIKAQLAGPALAEQLASGAVRKLVVFVRHDEAMETLCCHLQGFGLARISGGQTKGKRQENIDRFQNAPTCRVIVVKQQAGATALTLTAAHHVAMVEQAYTPADNYQAVKRCHRIGQTKPTLVQTFALRGSLDELIAQALIRKSRALGQLDLIEDKK